MQSNTTSAPDPTQSVAAKSRLRLTEIFVPFMVIELASADISACHRPCTESNSNKCANIAGSARSLICTISTSICCCGSRRSRLTPPNADRTTMRPIRPNPFIATFFAIAIYPRTTPRSVDYMRLRPHVCVLRVLPENTNDGFVTVFDILLFPEAG